MQRNWIGRSDGATVALPGRGARRTSTIEVFTTRPDTLFGATYMVLAPEHPLVDEIAAERVARRRRSSNDWASNALDAWKGIFGIDRPARRGGAPLPRVRRRRSPSSSARPRAREKTGVFTGAFAINPDERRAHPDLRRRLRADGLRHRRDHGRARARPARLRVRREFDLPIVPVIRPSDEWLAERGVDRRRRDDVARGVRRRRRRR